MQQHDGLFTVCKSQLLTIYGGMVRAGVFKATDLRWRWAQLPLGVALRWSLGEGIAWSAAHLER